MDEHEGSSLKGHRSEQEFHWPPCSLGRACSFLMMPFVLGIIGLTYIPYVHFVNNESLGGYALLTVFHVLLSLTLASYFQTVWTDPGTVPVEWHNIVASLPKPAYKKCRHSNRFKPLRSHYCSITHRVVLNLDHFCPWVANAVGFKNRKFFVLFCFYSMLTSAFSAITIAPYALSSFEKSQSENTLQKALALMAFIMDITFAIALALFSVAHFYMVSRNQTSLEGEKESRRYNRGWRENWQSVFGIDERFWFIPIHRSNLAGDGVHWPLADGSWDGFADKQSLPAAEEQL